MISIKSQILLAGAVSLLALSACNSKTAANSGSLPNDAVVATVNGIALKASSVDRLTKQSTAQGQPDSPELRKKIIDHLAMQSILSEQAIKKGLDKTPETLDQIDAVKQSILANAFIQDYIKNHPVTDDMVKAEYDKLKAEKSGNEYKARHILVAKEADAKDIIAKLNKDPKAFAALAKEKSMDPGSKANGGDLGWFDAGTMVPEFSAALAKLAKGKFTEQPVKSQFGYHVIMLDDVRPVQVPALDQVKDQLKQQILQRDLQKLVEDMKAKAKIEIVATAPAAATGSPAPAPAPLKK